MSVASPPAPLVELRELPAPEHPSAPDHSAPDHPAPDHRLAAVPPEAHVPSPRHADPFRPAPDDEPATTEDAWALSAMPTVPRVEREVVRPTRVASHRGFATTPWGPTAVGQAFGRRSPLAAWLAWPLLTLGIYYLVWYHHIHRELARFDPRRPRPVWGPVLVITLLGWTLVAPIASWIGTARRVATAQVVAGLPPTCRPGIAVLCGLALGAHVVYLQRELNRIADAYGDRPGARVALRD